jgi:hypothetical protein
VKRISLATSLYRAAMKAAREAATEVRGSGSFGYIDRLVSALAGRDRMRSALLAWTGRRPRGVRAPAVASRRRQGRSLESLRDVFAADDSASGLRAAATLHRPWLWIALAGLALAAAGALAAGRAAAGSSARARSSASPACSARASRSARPAGRSPG